MHSPTVRKGQSCQIQRFSSLDKSNLACKTKSMSTPDNLTKAARTTLVQARGLDRPVILTPVKVTTLDVKQYLSMLGGSTDSSPSYLSRLLLPTSDNLLRHRTTSFAGKPTQSLGGLYCPGSIKNMCHATWHSETHVKPNGQVISNHLIIRIYYHLFISWQIFNYLQGNTLSNNYLLAFIFKL